MLLKTIYLSVISFLFTAYSAGDEIQSILINTRPSAPHFLRSQDISILESMERERVIRTATIMSKRFERNQGCSYALDILANIFGAGSKITAGIGTAVTIVAGTAVAPWFLGASGICVALYGGTKILATFCSTSADASEKIYLNILKDLKLEGVDVDPIPNIDAAQLRATAQESTSNH